MRVFTKKSPDPSRASSSFHRSLPPHRRLGASTSPPDPSQLDVAHPERFASSTDSLLHILQSRASSLASPHLLPLHLHSSLVHALDFERHLVGHEGCVNRLAFNPSATLLASGSDDCTVRLWSLTRPLGPPLLTLETGHTANIFAVGFLKADRAIVSAGMDMDVRVCDVDTQQRLEVFRCHPNRVKELCVDPSNDRIFLTSGEDGSCRQFDLREPHPCQVSTRTRRGRLFSLTGVSSADSECCNALVADRALPLKCVDINPLQPHFFLLSADDQFIRVYDRRMIRMGNADTVHSPCYSRYAAGHLKRSHHSTFSQWDETGTQIVASYSGEQVYVYNFTGDDDEGYKRYTTSGERTEEEVQQEEEEKDSKAGAAPMAVDEDEDKRPTAVQSSPLDEAFPTKFVPSPAGVRSSASTLRPSLSGAEVAEVSRLKELGNAAFHSGDQSLSISYYNEALLLPAPLSPSVVSLLLSNRAAAYLKRSYPGDLPIALSDSMHAFRLDRCNLKALCRAVQCHRDMKRWSRGIKLGLYALDRLRKEGEAEGERDLKALVEEMQRERAKQRREESKRDETRGSGGAGGAGEQEKTARRQATQERRSKEKERQQRRSKRSIQRDREEKQAGGAGSSTHSGSSSGGGTSLTSSAAGASRDEKEKKRKMASLRTESEEEVRAMETEVTSEENDEAKRRRVNRSRGGEDRRERSREKAREGGDKAGKEEKDREEKKEREEKTAMGRGGGEARGDDDEDDEADPASSGGVWHELQEMEDEEFEELIRDTVNMNTQQWRDKYGPESDEEDGEGEEEGVGRRPRMADMQDEDGGDEEEEGEEGEVGDEEDEEEEEDDDDDDEEEEDDLEELLAPSSRRLLSRRPPDDEHETSASSLSDSPSMHASAPKPALPLPPPTGSHPPPPSATPSSSSTSSSTSTSAPSASAPPPPPPTFSTRTRRSFHQRFVGHANRQTDIKESTFWGPYILSGSDDGHVFLWDRRTARLLLVLRASEQIINCVRGHPHLPMVVTSGIDHEIGVWTVRERVEKEEGEVGREREEKKKHTRTGQLDGVVSRDEIVRLTNANQRRGEEAEEGWISGPLLASLLAQAMAAYPGRGPITAETLQRILLGSGEEEEDD